MNHSTEVRLLRRKITGDRLASPWTLLENIATWLAAGIVGLTKQAGKPSRFDRTAFAGVEEELRALGVRNVSRAIAAARRRRMTPEAVAGVIDEVQARAGDFDDPAAAIVARLVDLDELPPASPAARRRQADVKRHAEAIAAAAEARRAAEVKAARLRRAANRPAWDELTDDDRRRRIEETPNTISDGVAANVETFRGGGVHNRKGTRMNHSTDVRLLRRKITGDRLVSPWTLLEDIATWLPPSDERRAMRLIAHHRRQHEQAKRGAMIQGAD